MSALKEEMLRRALDNGAGWARIEVVRGHPGLVLPQHVVVKYEVRVPLDLHYDVISADGITSEGVDATLNFGRVPYSCHIPWGAIFAITGQKFGMVCLFPYSAMEASSSLRPALSLVTQNEDEETP